ncbi:Rv3654c family TadE-like protein [Crossiella sp. CA198]|uniref:Rv3654c family TadE-like protein n=1 Tax=Crossiella sp. CA198 TaxID=3455607 RepID=UPI003F8D4A2A
MRRPLAGDRGSVTVEAAICIASIAVVLALAFAGFRLAVTQLRCVDAAREAARLIARGEQDRAAVVVREMVPGPVQLSSRVEADAVRVEVVARPLGGVFPLRESAFALLEQSTEPIVGEVSQGRLPGAVGGLRRDAPAVASRSHQIEPAGAQGIGRLSVRGRARWQAGPRRQARLRTRRASSRVRGSARDANAERTVATAPPCEPALALELTLAGEPTPVPAHSPVRALAPARVPARGRVPARSCECARAHTLACLLARTRRTRPNTASEPAATGALNSAAEPKPNPGRPAATSDPRPRPTLGDDRGFATGLAVLVIAGLLAATVVLAHLGAVVAAGRRAAAAADLAALAAAGRLVEAGQGCAAAGRVAGEMGGRLAECLVDGWAVTVRVRVGLPGVLAVFGATSARARAGPAEL